MENATTQSSTPVSPSTSSNKDATDFIHLHKGAFIILILIIGALGLLSGYLVLKNYQSSGGTSLVNNDSKSATANSISGVLDINGMVPEGTTFDITATTSNNSTPITLASGLTANDDDTWQYTNAEPGESYTIQATAFSNGQQIAQSSPITVTAPATNVDLRLNITGDSNEAASISGGIVVNGFIPAGSTITIQGRQQGAQNFNNVVTNLAAKPRQVMTYANATAGTTYEVQGTLYNAAGTSIGTSGLVVVTAPAANEVLTINSSAQAPSPSPAPGASPTPPAQSNAQISGTVTLNGVAPPNSRITIFQKPYNSSNYQLAVDNITPVTGVSWTWTNPAPSTWYDVIAILKQKNSDGTDTDIATSAPASVAAPATNVNLTLNSSFQLSPPTGAITMSCGNQSGNIWNPSVTFTAVPNAQSYWYQIGTTNGGYDLTNGTANANGTSNLTINVQFHEGVTYYARYAYANQPNLGIGNSQFSPFSTTQQMSCN